MTGSRRTDRGDWPTPGPHRELLVLLDKVREENGRKSLAVIAAAMNLRSATRVNDILRGRRLPTDAAQVMALTRAMGGGVDEAEDARRKFTALDTRFADDLRSIYPELPRLPGHFVPRPAERALVVERLAEIAKTGRGTLGLASTAALHGTGGFGKTTLALDVCRQPEVARLFPDGVVWAERGQELSR